MTLALCTDSRFTTLHAPAGISEGPERMQSIFAHLEERQLLGDIPVIPCVPATREDLLSNHAPELIDAIMHASALDLPFLDQETLKTDTLNKRALRSFLGADLSDEELLRTFFKLNALDIPTTKDTFQVASLAAGGVLHAALDVWNEKHRSVFCLVRPPGHHAEYDFPMGYCYFNNIAIATRGLLAHGAKRIMIIDFDVHHGNGTQQNFYDDDRVLVANIHCDPEALYPGFSGFEDEIGVGAGVGYNINIPLPLGTKESRFLTALRQILERGAEFKPEVILVSAGYDAHIRDQKRAMKLETTSYAYIAHMIRDFAEVHCGGKMVWALEGGYLLSERPLADQGLAHGVGATLDILRGVPLSQVLATYNNDFK